jgi:hypothetical protein
MKLAQIRSHADPAGALAAAKSEHSVSPPFSPCSPPFSPCLFPPPPPPALPLYLPVSISPAFPIQRPFLPARSGRCARAL